jgi:hypothetical protein
MSGTELAWRSEGFGSAEGAAMAEATSPLPLYSSIYHA